MRFIVRYWSSVLPDEYRETDGRHRWLDYSIHPASKLGLHNALLAVHDRNEILAAHGGRYGCAVFVVEAGESEMLSPETADRLFAILPRGEVKWLDIREFLLPAHAGARAASLPTPATPAPPGAQPPAVARPAAQLPLFPHVHTPYDDLGEKPHSLDVDA